MPKVEVRVHAQIQESNTVVLQLTNQTSNVLLPINFVPSRPGAGHRIPLTRDEENWLANLIAQAYDRGWQDRKKAEHGGQS